jgi:gamma-glutamylcyclotransferase (GGCT)/AIG2-like uncharacterized protein YtfP
MNVFTYGTLMFPEIWERVVGRPAAAARGQVAGFSIYRVEGAEFPGIIASAGTSIVRGVVYLDVDAASLARLDAFEDDFYKRVPVAVDCDDGRRRQAEAYVVPEDRRAVLSDEPWQVDEFVARGGLDRFARHFAGFRRAVDAQLR